MQTENTTTPLQSAVDAMEDARIELIEKLSAEANANRKEIDLLKQEVRDLNSKRADLTQRWKHAEAQKVAETIQPILAAIKDCEAKSTEFEFKLKNAREGRAPELQGHVARTSAVLQNHRLQEIEDIAREFRAHITQEARDFMLALVANNPDRARSILLAEFGLKLPL